MQICFETTNEGVFVVQLETGHRFKLVEEETLLLTVLSGLIAERMDNVALKNEIDELTA